MTLQSKGKKKADNSEDESDYDSEFEAKVKITATSILQSLTASVTIDTYCHPPP